MSILTVRKSDNVTNPGWYDIDMFINGAAVYKAQRLLPPTGGTAADVRFAIGRNQSAVEPFKGLIDEIRITSGTRTDE